LRLWERILHALGLIEVEADPGDEDSFEEKQVVKRGNVVKFHPPDENYKLILSKPGGFPEVEDIAGYLKGRKPVVLNLENLDSTEARRTVDFLSGVVFALNGSSQKINGHIFVFAPAGVTLSADVKSRIVKHDDRITEIDPYFKE